MIFKFLFAASLVAASPEPDDGWVYVPRPDSQAVHRFEEEEPGLWVVYAKTFGEERILIHFPEDPSYRRMPEGFTAYAPAGKGGELAIIMEKKSAPSRETLSAHREISYRDPDNGHLIRERHIETEQHHYVLRLSHSVDNPDLFIQFADSFEIERNGNFSR